MKPKRVVFLTGTRADFGKLKSIMRRLCEDESFEVHLFVTGMHMLSKYGYTCDEVVKSGFPNIYRFINQNPADRMDVIVAKTIMGLSDYYHEIRPDLQIVHGDRVEALAAATVGALGNVRTAHIEGGEVSGTVDEAIRHSVSKLSHAHFVANDGAKSRLRQLGERDSSIFVVGSPDVDAMNSADLPDLAAVQARYDFDYSSYGVLLFHAVTSEVDEIGEQVKAVVDAVLQSKRKFIVIYPNNDHGSDRILEEYRRFRGQSDIKVFPSIRFEYFLALLRDARFILGNSSAGVREAPHFGVPAVNIGTRQHNRVKHPSIIGARIECAAILEAIEKAERTERVPEALFGSGNSAAEIHQIIKAESFWELPLQKFFVDQILK